MLLDLAFAARFAKWRQIHEAEARRAGVRLDADEVEFFDACDRALAVVAAWNVAGKVAKTEISKVARTGTFGMVRNGSEYRNGHVGVDRSSMVDVNEAARILGCSDRNIRPRLSRGTLPGRRGPGGWRVDRDAVLALREAKCP